VVNDYIEREEGLTLTINKGNRAYYSKMDDAIVTPTMRQAVDEMKKHGQTTNDGKQHYYSTLFHEMVHSSGTEERCNRDTIQNFNFFGDHEYSKEELVLRDCSPLIRRNNNRKSN
jgi:antirestriction protein ArdC